MDGRKRKNHWEDIYLTKEPKEVSWYQAKPETSLHYFNVFQVPLSAKIIDVGGGDTYLVDFLLEAGYTQVTVLDISEKALNRAKERLGEKAALVSWIVADAAHFQPTEKYDFWHDRAAFHFLTEVHDIANYICTAAEWINPNGILVVGTFSENGPTKCSGIEIKQYAKNDLAACFEAEFEKIECIDVDHTTPFGTVQNFTFCSFRRK